MKHSLLLKFSDSLWLRNSSWTVRKVNKPQWFGSNLCAPVDLHTSGLSNLRPLCSNLYWKSKIGLNFWKIILMKLVNENTNNFLMDLTIVENVGIRQWTIVQCCWGRRQGNKALLGVEDRTIRKKRYWMQLMSLLYFLLQNSHTNIL